MSYPVSDEAKEFEGSQGNWFGFGVHEVTVGEVAEGQTDSGTDFVEFTVLGDNEEEDTARVWLTDKSEKYSFATLKQIYTHCAPDDKKDKAREEMEKCKDYTEVVDLLQKCIGSKIWFTKYPDPTRTYQAADGTTKKSINKNVYGYEPKLKPELMPKDGDKDALNQTFPGSEDATNTDAAKGIPKNW